jgi:hypothetical protein
MVDASYKYFTMLIRLQDTKEEEVLKRQEAEDVD